MKRFCQKLVLQQLVRWPIAASSGLRALKDFKEYFIDSFVQIKAFALHYKWQ
jgi:hypothetical protein